MDRTFRFHELVTNRISPVVASAALLFVAQCFAQPADCEKGEPADLFSTKIDTLLTEVEGAGFSSDANLSKWSSRKGEIQAKFAEILDLAASDVRRRKAAVEALLAAESLAVDEDTAQRLWDRSRGEVRAWIRRVFKEYGSLGITQADWTLVDSDLITALRTTWNNLKIQPPRRSLSLYQTKAAALRGYAQFSCGSEP